MLQCISSGACSLSTSLGKGCLKMKGQKSLLPHGETGPSPSIPDCGGSAEEAKDT